MRFGAILTVAVAAAVCGCDRRESIDRVEWTAMGTVAAVQTRGSKAEGPAQSAKTTFEEIEKLLSAFDPASELNRLKTLGDAEVLEKCSPEVRPCYEAAFRMRDETGGAFNPRWKGEGTLDLGAIAKGYAVDLAAERCKTGLIDLGGNLKAVGGDWNVGILGGGNFTLKAGEACATSGRYFRGNHIKDGRTGGDFTNSVYSVTVIHPSSAMLADGLSTVMFILGKEKGEAFLKARHPEAKACWIFRE